MRPEALGDAAAHLPWLTPCAASLMALARLPAAVAWERLRCDPAAVLLAIRQARHRLAAPASFTPHLLHDPAVLEGAVQALDFSSGFVDWNLPEVDKAYRAACTIGRLATQLAKISTRADPELAWISGLLSPLGWLAACALHSDPLAMSPADAARIARRLARRWRLPGRLAAVAGHLDLPPDVAQTMGADEPLFRIVQMAAALARRQGLDFIPDVGCSLDDNAAWLGIETKTIQEVERGAEPLALPTEWIDPQETPLLRDLLQLALETRRQENEPSFEALENEVDRLHDALASTRHSEEERLRTLKLGALAEFAAGAGHEINNPLAVISGQAQYLLHAEPEPARQRSLQTIVAQAQRIHQILTGLMQFARPAKPRKLSLDAGEVIHEVTESLKDLAGQRRVNLVCPTLNGPIEIEADAAQVRTALSCLLKNAIEAAPADGWAGIRVECPAPDLLELVVEDNGGGPTASQREHLFDPFYSGRLAGRGRGLGLSTAWRLAREHGGDVRYDHRSEGPTRFVLSLPRQPHRNGQHATNGSVASAAG